MYKNSWSKGKFYWSIDNKYVDLPLLLFPMPVNEKQSMLYSRVEVNVKVTLEFKKENVHFKYYMKYIFWET